MKTTPLALALPALAGAQGGGAAASLSRLHNEYEAVRELVETWAEVGEATGLFDAFHALEPGLAEVAGLGERAAVPTDTPDVEPRETPDKADERKAQESSLVALVRDPEPVEPGVRGMGSAPFVRAYVANGLKLAARVQTFSDHVAFRDDVWPLAEVLREQVATVSRKESVGTKADPCCCCCCPKKPTGRPAASLAGAVGLTGGAALGDGGRKPPWALIVSTNLPGDVAGKLSGAWGASKLGSFLSENVVLDLVIPVREADDRGHVLGGVAIGLPPLTFSRGGAAGSGPAPPSWPFGPARQQAGAPLNVKLSLTLRSVTPHFLSATTLASDSTLAEAKAITIPGVRVELFSAHHLGYFVAIDWSWPRGDPRNPGEVLAKLVLADPARFRPLEAHRLTLTFGTTIFR